MFNNAHPTPKTAQKNLNFKARCGLFVCLKIIQAVETRSFVSLLTFMLLTIQLLQSDPQPPDTVRVIIAN